MERGEGMGIRVLRIGVNYYRSRIRKRSANFVSSFKIPMMSTTSSRGAFVFPGPFVNLIKSFRLNSSRGLKFSYELSTVGKDLPWASLHHNTRMNPGGWLFKSLRRASYS